MLKRIEETANYIKEKTNKFNPKIGIVLGSGLGEFADQIENKIEIPYSEIPNFHQTTVKGHNGRLVCGTIDQVEVVVFQGRYHFYEGHDVSDVVLPVRVLAKLGVEKLILTNASGGINPDYIPSDLVCITDHINLTGTNPLIGSNIDEIGVRFPDMSEAYCAKLNVLLHDTATEIGLNLKSGVYAGLLGPSYETPAEIKMLEVLGADMVGMSTVPESIAANHAGLQVCGISCITNLAAGISKDKLNHDDVKDVSNKVINNFTLLLKKAVVKMGNL